MICELAFINRVISILFNNYITVLIEGASPYRRFRNTSDIWVVEGNQIVPKDQQAQQPLIQRA